MSTTAIYDPSLGPMDLSTPRRLGGVFGYPRVAYLLYLPFFMGSVGLICWLVPTDLMLMFGSVALALVSIYLFYGLAVQQAPLRVTTLLVSTLGLGYGLGAANTWFTLPRSGMGLGEFLHKDPAALTHTMGSILVSMAVLLAVGEYAERPIFGEDFELIFPPQSIVFITAGVAIIVVAYIKGSLTFMGADVGAEGHLSIFASFAGWLVNTLVAITFVAALNAKSTLLKVYLGVLTLMQFVMLIPLGRRTMIFAVLLCMISLRLGRFRFNWSWPKRIVVGILLAGTLYITSIGFFYLRLAGYASGRQHLGLVERVTLAISYFHNKSFSEVQQTFSKNVQGRTFILGFLAELEDYSQHFTPGLGRDLQGQIEEAIPSALDPGKNRFFEEEGLDNELFGSSYLDEANSILTGGATDFGLLGMIAYPLLICWVVRSFFEFLGQALPTFVATFIITAAMGGLLQPESAITAYFVLIRNGILFGSVVWFFMALPAFRLSKEV